MAEYKAKLKTVEKWEKDLKVKLSKDLEGYFVTELTCVLCMKHVDSIKHHKTFTKIWINGLKSVKKDCIQKHLNREAHEKANKLEQKRQLGAVGFKEKVVKDTTIGRGITKMGEKDLETLTGLMLKATIMALHKMQEATIVALRALLIQMHISC